MKSKLSELTIRAYQEADREGCRGLWRELVEWHREIYTDPTIGGEHPEEYFDRHIAKFGTERIWVALSGTRIIGFAGLVIEGEEVKIEPIVVAKAFKRKGAGKQLVKALTTEAKKLGARYLNVEPVVRNAEAIRFYHELGFVNLGKVQLFIDLSGKKCAKSLKLHKQAFNY